MANIRFHEMGIDSFFGHFIYERIVPRDHLLVQLVGLIDCDAFTEILVPAYAGLAQEGWPPCSTDSGSPSRGTSRQSTRTGAQATQ